MVVRRVWGPGAIPTQLLRHASTYAFPLGHIPDSEVHEGSVDGEHRSKALCRSKTLTTSTTPPADRQGHTPPQQQAAQGRHLAASAPPLPGI